MMLTERCAPAEYAPMKVIAGVSNTMFVENPSLKAQLITPLLTSGTIFGASVFDADQSQLSNFALEQSLWGATA